MQNEPTKAPAEDNYKALLFRVAELERQLSETRLAQAQAQDQAGQAQAAAQYAFVQRLASQALDKVRIEVENAALGFTPNPAMPDGIGYPITGLGNAPAPLVPLTQIPAFDALGAQAQIGGVPSLTSVSLPTASANMQGNAPLHGAGNRGRAATTGFPASSQPMSTAAVPYLPGFPASKHLAGQGLNQQQNTGLLSQQFAGMAAPGRPSVAPEANWVKNAFGPKPVRKPQGPYNPGDPGRANQQQLYEEYLEHCRATDPNYAIKCKQRQARRAERQRGQREGNDAKAVPAAATAD
ncbi:hypothetical protein GGR56DRAFT_578308 [Xylariaceae sp. FL0804]|nr:hypothetical protein GGR56DRAFT_578308 [Xylariaceae sp. FL0804]